jgi:2-(3-amino-3-carboxypropyl)histidine synthase
MEWDLNLESAKAAIKQYNAKKVLIQLPDGIKPHAKVIVDGLKNEGAELFIWTDSNYGACDLPIEARNVGVDLILHFGHEAWDYKKPPSENAPLVAIGNQKTA